MLQTVTPQFRITDARRSLAFYVDGLGFQVDWEHRFEPGYPVFMQLTRAGQALFLTEHAGDCQVGGAAYFVVPDVDACYNDFVGRGVMLTQPPAMMPWGPREMVVMDPDGNRLRFATRLEPTVSSKLQQDLIRVAHDWDRAMVGNDADEIGHYMADDWIIVGSDGKVGDKATFLELVRSGALTHDEMTSEDLDVRVYGDTAVVTARGVSGGKYQDQLFREVERSSCVFVSQEGHWRCVLTHLSRLAQGKAL